VLIAGFLGLGALAAAQQVPFPIAVLSTVVIWALPGQIIFVEMSSVDASVAATVIAVMLSSARFLPMTVMFMPEIRDPAHRPWKYYALAHVLSLSGWTMAVIRFPDIPRPQRLNWYFGFAIVLMLASSLSTAAGYLGADQVSPMARLVLVFMVPMYYLLILASGANERVAAIGLACGAIAGPLAQLVTPEWGVVVAGLVGGTVAFLLLRKR
jgi:predicted branched-subunit amino acid permease